MSKALCRLVLALFGVPAALAAVAMFQVDTLSTEVKKDASKHWVDGTNRDNHVN